MSLHVKIATTVNRVRTFWALGMVVAILWVVFSYPAWYLLFLLPFGFVTYMGCLFIAALVISRDLSDQDLREVEEADALQAVKDKLSSGDHDPEEVIELMEKAGFTDIVVVEETGPVIGNYKENPIYEYVLVKAPKATQLERYAYHGPAEVVDGIPQIPVLDGLIFAHVQGILYSKEQPV